MSAGPDRVQAEARLVAEGAVGVAQPRSADAVRGRTRRRAPTSASNVGHLGAQFEPLEAGPARTPRRSAAAGRGWCSRGRGSPGARRNRSRRHGRPGLAQLDRARVAPGRDVDDRQPRDRADQPVQAGHRHAVSDRRPGRRRWSSNSQLRVSGSLLSSISGRPVLAARVTRRAMTPSVESAGRQRRQTRAAIGSPASVASRANRARVLMLAADRDLVGAGCPRSGSRPAAPSGSRPDCAPTPAARPGRPRARTPSAASTSPLRPRTVARAPTGRRSSRGRSRPWRAPAAADRPRRPAARSPSRSARCRTRCRRRVPHGRDR